MEQKTVRLSETVVKRWNKDVVDRTAPISPGALRYRSDGIVSRRAVAGNDDRSSERFLSGGKFSVVDVRDSSLLGCKKLQNKATSWEYMLCSLKQFACMLTLTVFHNILRLFPRVEIFRFLRNTCGGLWAASQIDNFYKRIKYCRRI